MITETCDTERCGDDFSVAVVMPAYNCETSIERAVNSIVSQSVPVREIVIVDDGSSDGTVDVVKKLQQTVDCIRLIEQANGGPAKARNTGIENASSQWIAFLDADDAWLPNRLERQKQLIDANPELNWASGAFTKVKMGSASAFVELHRSPFSRDLEEGQTGVFNALKEIADGTALWTGCMLIRRSELTELKGFAPQIKGSEDIDLWVRLAIRNSMLGFVTDPIALYTVDQPNSVVGVNARSLDLTKFEFYERIRSLVKQSDSPTREYLEKLLRIKIQNYTNGMLRTGESKVAKAFFKLLRERDLPLPRLRSQLISLIPESILKSIRSMILSFGKRR